MYEKIRLFFTIEREYGGGGVNPPRVCASQHFFFNAISKFSAELNYVFGFFQFEHWLLTACTGNVIGPREYRRIVFRRDRCMTGWWNTDCTTHISVPKKIRSIRTKAFGTRIAQIKCWSIVPITSVCWKPSTSKIYKKTPSWCGKRGKRFSVLVYLIYLPIAGNVLRAHVFKRPSGQT